MLDCAGCNLIEVQPVALSDGRTVCSSCEDYRAECEARQLLQKPRQERQAYYGLVESKRGKTAATDLVERVNAIYRRGQG